MPSLDLQRMIEKLDGTLVVALEDAVNIAVQNSAAAVEIEHWLMAFARQDDFFIEIIEKSGIAMDRLMDELAQATRHGSREVGASPAISQQLIELCREAWVHVSLSYGRPRVTLADLLLVLMTDSLLRSKAITVAPCLRDVSIGELERLADGVETADDASPVVQNNSLTPKNGAEDFLAAYTIDLTKQAQQGEIDTVIGRDDELRQMMDILIRRRQNNPILVGEAGVGKTALVEALALAIVADDVPPTLKQVRLLSLDLTLLQAGASVKGEFERRLKGVIDQVKTSPEPIILFIDEAHGLVGAGGQSGQGDAANIMKPALARGELRTIAATTWAEYKKYFEKDAALTRRFQVVSVGEPDQKTAIRMVRSLVPLFEKHHGVTIREQAVEAAVVLSTRYIQGRQLPDKAVSLLDTACAAVRISRSTVPLSLRAAQNDLQQLELELNRLESEPSSEENLARKQQIVNEIKAVQTQIDGLSEQYEKETELLNAADTLEKEAEASDAKFADLAKIEADLYALQGSEPMLHRVVDQEAVAAVASRWTGVPIGRLMHSLIEAATGLEERLSERVVGQAYATKIVADSIITARAGLGDERRPTGVFLFVGTSGVGKTETALALSDMIYGGPQSMTVINMSEFKEEHKVSLLLGSPPGYVGYGEGGILTEAVRRRPYGLLLLDEMDKAHPGVQDIFYQVFDKGMLKDGEGRDIDFKNTTIVMTANTGTRTLTALAADPETMPEGKPLSDLLMPELMEQFKPAFLGRVSVVPFLPLTHAVLQKIASIQIDRLRKRLAERYQADLTLTEAALDALVSRSEAVETGARAIEETLSQQVLPKLSLLMLKSKLDGEKIHSVVIDLDDNQDFKIISNGSKTADHASTHIRKMVEA